MLNKFIQATWLCGKQGLLTKHCEQLIKRMASFTPQNIIRENSDETGTLLTTFAKHVAFELQKVTPIVPTEIRYANYFPITDLKYLKYELYSIPAEQLPALITFAFNYRPSADPVKFSFLLNELDRLSLKLLPDMDEDTVLRTLYAFVFLMPNWITRLDFYHASTKRLATKDFTPDSGKEKFVQLCFYLGLMKKRSFHGSDGDLLHTILEKHLDFFLPELTTMDLAVIANAAYKTSTRIKSISFGVRLEEEVENLLLNDNPNDALIVTFVKAMRLERIISKSLCEKLSKFCTQNDTFEKLQARGLVHICAYFAQNLWDNMDYISQIKTKFMGLLTPARKFENQNEYVRCKDIATFLWCCSQLNCKLTPGELKVIESVLLSKLDRNEFEHFPDQLVDSCLSLWMLGLKSRDLIDEVVSLKTQLVARQKRDKPKVESRFDVLLTAVAIEKPTWKLRTNVKLASPFNLEKAVEEYLLRDRMDLSMLSKQLSSEEGVSNVKIICPINGINIPSIVVHYNDSDTKYFVELITPDQELLFSKEPFGVLSLKIQLLETLGHKVVELRPEQLKTNYTNLKDLLKGCETEDQQKLESLSSI